MKKTILPIVIMLFGITIANAQDKTPRPASIQLGFTYAGTYVDLPHVVYDGVTCYSGNSISIDASWINISERLNCGAYLDLGAAASSDGEAVALITSTIGLHYGASLSYHLFAPSNTRWDLAFRGTLGSYWCPSLSPQSEYGLGANLTYYPLEHLGVFVENLWGKFLFNGYYDPIIGRSNSKLIFGISYRF